MVWSVHDEPDFARVYDEDDEVTIRRGDLRALLDIGTGSMDFGSGFMDNEQVEALRKVAVLLGVDPVTATPPNFLEQYVCRAKGEHQWRSVDYSASVVFRSNPIRWVCDVCRHTSTDVEKPSGPA